jgi:hypothetical protein
MKKVLLSLIAVAGFFANSYSQCISGYHSTGVYDDFSSTTEVGDANGGLYFFSGSGTGGCASFSATQSRTANPGKLSVAMVGPYGCYVPFGYSFGKNANNKTNTIDLSGNKTFSVDFTNLVTDTSKLVFRFAIMDSLGNILDTYAAVGTAGAMPAAGSKNCDNAWAFPITTPGTMPGAATYNFTGTFAGAYQADYSKSGSPAAGTTGAGCYLKNALDFTIVSQILFTVTSGYQNAADNYNPYAIGLGSAIPIFTLDNLKLGICPTTGTNAAQANVSSAKLFPNPTSDMARVELNLFNPASVKVTLSDLMGKEVMTIAEGTTSALAKDFSVANLNKGVYTVNYFINGAAAKSELLMVK